MKETWADEPYSLIPTPTEEQTEGVHDLSHTSCPQANEPKFHSSVVTVARDMCLAHNAMIRNLNAIYLQCEQVVQPRDQADFIIFCQTAIEVIHSHHQLEETTFFPQISKYTGEPDIMLVNVEQHRAFDAGLTTFEEHIYRLEPENYDGRELKRLLEAFTEVLVKHLHEEIPTLLALQRFPGEELGHIYDEFNKHLLSEIEDKHRVLPCALSCIDRTFEDGKNAEFPPLPFFVPYLVKYYYGRRYSGSWRFSPCTMFGQPKRLEFTKDSGSR